MGKGNNRRSNKEVKKPKKVKKKPSATAYSNAEKKPFAAILMPKKTVCRDWEERQIGK